MGACRLVTTHTVEDSKLMSGQAQRPICPVQSLTFELASPDSHTIRRLRLRLQDLLCSTLVSAPPKRLFPAWPIGGIPSSNLQSGPSVPPITFAIYLYSRLWTSTPPEKASHRQKQRPSRRSTHTSATKGVAHSACHLFKCTFTHRNQYHLTVIYWRRTYPLRTVAIFLTVSILENMFKDCSTQLNRPYSLAEVLFCFKRT